MRLATGLSPACTDPSNCPPPSPTEFYGQARVPVAEAPAAESGAFSPLPTAALALLVGALLGAGLIYQYSERVERMRARHWAAVHLRSAIEPLLAGFRRAERDGQLAAVAEALNADLDRIAVRIELLTPLISGNRAERLSRRLSELRKLIAEAPASPADRPVLGTIRWSLRRLLLNSYL